MAVYDVEIRVSNGTNYDDIIHVKTKPILVEGLLDENQKIQSKWFPVSIADRGMEIIRAIYTTQDITVTSQNLLIEIQEYAANTSSLAKGKYFAFPYGVELILNVGHVIIGADEFVSPTLGNDTSLFLESGDWLVYWGEMDVQESGSLRHTWGVINNTYKDATMSSKGIVRLAYAAEVAAGLSTISAVTPAGLKSYVSTNAPTLAQFNTLNADVTNHIGSGGTAHARATESTIGFTRFATQQETFTSSDQTIAISPLNLRTYADTFFLRTSSYAGGDILFGNSQSNYNEPVYCSPDWVKDAIYQRAKIELVSSTSGQPQVNGRIIFLQV